MSNIEDIDCLIILCVDLPNMTMPKSKAKAKAPGTRGKRSRKSHVIYEIEARLGLSHLDIARLLEPTLPGLDIIEGICKSPQISPSVQKFEFSINELAVTRMISGGGKSLSLAAPTRLCFRLGIRRSSYISFNEKSALLDSDGNEFEKSSVTKYHQEARRATAAAVNKGGKLSAIEFGMMFPDRVTMTL